LLEAGALPVNEEAAEVLRVESGEPVYGIDVDDSVLLPELRREDLISYTKGCYIGQELVARVKYRGHVNRALAGLRLEGDTVPAAGTPVMAEGKEIGRLTSSARSLALGVPIALGYLRREHLEPGAPVAVGGGEPLIPARVAALPFV
jgi:folate-binding protein YgfZ